MIWNIRLRLHGKGVLIECCRYNRRSSISPTETENPQFSLPACIAAFEKQDASQGFCMGANKWWVEGIDALATDVYLS